MEKGKQLQRFEDTLNQKNTRQEISLITREMIDEKNRTIHVTLTSEFPVYRQGWVENWYEILVHNAQAIDLTRAEGMNYLNDHDPTQDVGVFENFGLDAAKRVTGGDVRFGTDPQSEISWTKHKDGIRTKVSAGYIPRTYEKATLEQVRPEFRALITDPDAQIYLITNWQPAEGSSVTVPADTNPKVGAGRSQDSEILNRGGRNMKTPEEIQKENEMRDQIRNEEVAKLKITTDEQSKKSRENAKEILAVAQKHRGMKDIDSLASKAIEDGTSAQEFKSRLFELVNPSAVRVDEDVDGRLGLSEKEIRKYSFCKAIRTWGSKTEKFDGLEEECHREAMKKYKTERSGFIIPDDVLYSGIEMNKNEAAIYSNLKARQNGLRFRTMDVANDAKGGNLVATNLLVGSFIEMLDNMMVMFSLGVRRMEGLVGDVAIPGQNGRATMYWLGEEDTVTPSDQAIRQLAMTPHIAAAQTIFTKKLLTQSSIGVEAFVREDLARIMALGLDSMIINGTGANNQPTGILATAGIGSVVLGANGDVPTYLSQVALEASVDVANALTGALAYLGNAKVKAMLKTTVKESGFPEYLYDNQTKEVNGYPFYSSNQVPSNLVKGGSGAICSAEIFGDFSQCLLGMWGGLSINTDPYTLMDTLQYRVVSDMMVDMVIRHTGALAAIKDMKTTGF